MISFNRYINLPAIFSKASISNSFGSPWTSAFEVSNTSERSVLPLFKNSTQLIRSQNIDFDSVIWLISFDDGPSLMVSNISKWGVFSRWLVSPNPTWSSIKTSTIENPHPTLVAHDWTFGLALFQSLNIELCEFFLRTLIPGWAKQTLESTKIKFISIFLIWTNFYLKK